MTHHRRRRDDETDVVTVDEESTFRRLVGMMHECRVSALPVVDEGGAHRRRGVGGRPPGEGGSRGVHAALHRATGSSCRARQGRGGVAGGLMTAPAVTIDPACHRDRGGAPDANEHVKRLFVTDEAGGCSASFRGWICSCPSCGRMRRSSTTVERGDTASSRACCPTRSRSPSRTASSRCRAASNAGRSRPSWWRRSEAVEGVVRRGLSLDVGPRRHRERRVRRGMGRRLRRQIGRHAFRRRRRRPSSTLDGFGASGWAEPVGESADDQQEQDEAPCNDVDPEHPRPRAVGARRTTRGAC